MGVYLLRRLALFPLVLAGVSVMMFVLLRAVPGNAVEANLGLSTVACPACVTAAKRTLGLDKPLFLELSRPASVVDSQYTRWLEGVVHLDFGVSATRNGLPINQELQRRAGVSFELALVAMAMTALLGLPVGLLSAAWAGKLPDYAARIVSALGLSLPGFWIATLVIILPAIWWGMNTNPRFPTRDADPVGHYRALLLPAFVISLNAAAYLARYVRSSMIEVLYSDYVRTARAKGLTERLVLGRHVLRSSLIPVITVMGLQFGTLLGGAIVVENIFGIPGLGSWAVDAVVKRDYQIVLAITMVTCAAFLAVNLAVDIAYAWADPRIRYE